MAGTCFLCMVRIREGARETYHEPKMRTLNGQYELEHDIAAFFGARTMRFVARDSYVTGRFGREGVIRGSMNGHELLAQWRDKRRSGWLRIRFAPSFKTAELEFGVDASSESLGHSVLIRVVRSSRRPTNHPC